MRERKLFVVITALAVILSVCAGQPPSPGAPVSPVPAGSIRVERSFPDLTFQEMTNLVQPDSSGSLLFVTEQRGVVRAFDPGQQPPVAYVFLDIRDRVNRGGDEEGLLGLAFDPGYRQNGYLYIY